MSTTPATEPTTTSPVPGGALPDTASADRTPTAHPSWTDLLAEAERLNRAQLMPHYLCASLLALAGIIHSMSAQAEATGAAALLAGSACAVGGTIGFLLMRRRHEWMQAWALWAALVSAATALWMVIAVIGGVTWGTLAAALAIDTAAGARWWAHHRHGLRPQTPAAVPSGSQAEKVVPISEAELARFARLWAENIGNTGGSNGVLPGSMLIPTGMFEHGVEYTIQLVPGKQDLDMVLGSLGKIASGLRWPKQQLLVEHYPTSNADSALDPSKLRLRVVLRSPIKKDVFFRGPKYDNGNITLGPYADGVGQAVWRLYGRDSMWGGMVIGGTGSGKSRLLELIGLVALWTGLTYVIHVDGQDGISCPTLWKHAHEHYASHEVDTVLARLDAFKTHRQRNPRTPAPADVDTADYDEDEEEKGGFTPSPDYPGILVIVDEAHVVITKDNVEQWAALAREARKVGIAIIMGDQDGSLETFLKSVLRGSLRAGNAVGLKTDERAQGQIVSNGRFNLTDLPAIPGYGYTLGVEARQAPYRGEFLPSAKNKREMAEAGAPLPDDVLTVGQWYRQARDHRVENLDPATLAAGDAAAAAVVSAASMRDAITRGKTVTRGKTAGALDLKLVRLQMPVVGAPAPRTVAPAPAPVAPAGETALVCEELTESARRVLDAVREGNTMPSQIAEAVELTRQQVQTLLRGLIDAELLSKTGAGPSVRYEITEQGMAVA